VPGTLTYASAGNGSITHLVTEYFLDVAGIEIVHAAYKGTSPALADVPTAAETGYAASQVTNWHGLVGPKGRPREIVVRLNAAVNASLQGASMESGLASDGLSASGGSADEFGAVLASEMSRRGAIARKRNIRAE
jgi:tripartite-type tricarboxylate transporter receptor subunit TctC